MSNSIMKKLIFILPLTFFLIIIIGCAATRTDIDGLYKEQQNFGKKRFVKVLFDIYYYTLQTGMDAIPKIRLSSGVYGFDDIFKESLKELTNIEEYETYYNSASDINNTEKRKERENKIEKADYVIKLEFLQENSFSKHYLGILVTTLSLDLIPIGYTWDYKMTATIMEKENEIIGKYSRSASVTNWYQLLLLVLFPFNPEEAKTEEVYIESLKNIFFQIENESILK